MSSVKQQIWDYFIKKDFKPEGIAGMMGNFQHESGFMPNNVENRWNNSTGKTDAQYTEMVDNGSYTNFVHDGYGYGIPQYTYFSYKQDLLNMAKERNVSIADLTTQLDLLCDILMNDVGIYNRIKTATNITDASNLFLLKFERPADQSERVKNERAATSKAIYDEMKNLTSTTIPTVANFTTVVMPDPVVSSNGKMKYHDKNIPLACMMTQSTCYKNTSKMNVKGVLWHSTGANNNTLKRYVQPDDTASNRAEMLNLIGKNQYGNDWNHIDIQAGLNAWIGCLADGTVTTLQVMPWDYEPWGCGAGSKGSCNDGWIQFEICEDNLTNKNYFDKAYEEACQITAYLCKLFDLNPKGNVTYNGIAVPVILCHQDSYQLNLGSNHSDVYHWFNKYGKTMDNVRNDVAKLMDGTTTTVANTIANMVKPLASARPIIKRGMVGAIVKALQTNLIALGFLCGPDGADGDFGPNTEKAVKEFQEAHNLEVDGIVGDETYEAIENAIINTPPQPTPAPTPTPRPQYKGVKIGSSSKDENGSYRGGQAGDQTSEEVWIQDWYPGWNYVIRPKDANVAERMARECENACNNDYIGYDQWQRNSLYTEAKKVGLDLSKITTPCECDCSSLVSICCICAGMPESIFYAGGNMRTTYSLLQACEATGQYVALTNPTYTNSKDYLKRGDILLNDGHTVIVLSNGSKVDEVAPVVHEITTETVLSKPYLVIITTNVLNVRSGPSTSNAVVTTVKKNEIFTIVAEKGGWGKLKSGAGWIDLNYTQPYNV